MKVKMAFMLLLGGIAYVVDISVVNMICYTLSSILIIGAMATAVGPKNFIIMLLVCVAIAALYILAMYLIPSGDIPHS